MHPPRMPSPLRCGLPILLLLGLWGAVGTAVPAAARESGAPGQEQAEGIREPAPGGEGAHEAPAPPVWLITPFVALLLMIATGPLFYPHHWHRHYPKYAVGLGTFVTVYYVVLLGAPLAMYHALQEYISFMALVASLFVAASGIYLKVNARGTPLANVLLLSVGCVVSNLIATTGAAMLFIRPYLRLNEGRVRAYHVVFFIFLVANVGGALTPIGDPPLFLGFLRGVPFFWTLTHIWYIWLPTTAILLLIFYVFDRGNKAVSTALPANGRLVEITGSRSFLFVGVIIASVFVDPNVLDWIPTLAVGDLALPFGLREIVMFTAAFLAFRLASREALAMNEFTFEPIKEVGWLFLGIFACMVPALNLITLFAHDHADALGVGMTYWGTGALSSFLDNAPTYLNFLAAAMGKFGVDVNDPAHVRAFADPALVHADSWVYLQAISVAAVFFGAMSYIGNAPNFMVKAIAEANNVDTPSFGGYLGRYALPILIPVYGLIWLVFYSGWIVPF